MSSMDTVTEPVSFISGGETLVGNGVVLFDDGGEVLPAPSGPTVAVAAA
jgi:hypothetical protein